MFDRINEVYANGLMVPFYPVIDRTPEVPPGYTAYRRSVVACAAVPTGPNPGGQRHSPHGRALAPRSFAGPLATTAIGDGRHVPSRGSTESYSHAAVAAVDARRHQLLPPHANRWDGDARGASGADVAGGEDPRSRRQAPAQHPYPYPSGPNARPVMTTREGGRDQGYHVGGAWPQYQRQPGRRDVHGSASMYSEASMGPEAQGFRHRVPGWRGSSAGEWS